MDNTHPIPDPTEHPDFHERGHWFADTMAVIDMIVVGVLISAAVVGFWLVLAWLVLRQ